MKACPLLAVTVNKPGLMEMLKKGQCCVISMDGRSAGRERRLQVTLISVLPGPTAQQRDVVLPSEAKHEH